jgi:uncharacterized protein (DUF2126 family)
MAMNQPYTEEQWQKIDALGCAVEEQLQRLGVGLTMGGEPTFVSLDDFKSPQWRVEALGEEKRKIAGQLLQRLEWRFSSGGALLHYGVGKWYPGEDYPRWALGCYWREDGVPIWRDRSLMAEEGKDYDYTAKDAQVFIDTLAKILGVNPDCILSARDPDEVLGYTLPLLLVDKNGLLCWTTCPWTLPDKGLMLVKGNSSIGLRLPLNSIPWRDRLEEEANAAIAAIPFARSRTYPDSPPNSICVALSLEVRRGILSVFLPPIASAGSFLDLIAAIEETAAMVGTPILIEGYAPPSNPGIAGFQITPDPGVIEVNIHPARNWEELVEINAILYEEAQQCRLGTEKYTLEGQRISTGGGAHITLGGKTVQDSPLLRRPDLLRSLITYFQHHPSLSYLFSGQFVGPTSQSPRVDEARHESLYELEIAFQTLQPFQDVAAEVIDRLLQPLLVDVTGNTHRSALCIDKLFPANNFRSRLGLLEFRAFAMPPDLRMRLLQLLLVRALVAWFWEKPYTQPLIRWGTMLHDRFLLPYYLKEDLARVVTDLEGVGYPFELDWFEPFFEFRFPRYGEMKVNGVQLELRHAIEPWLVLGEAVNSGGTSRPVDASMERIQVMLRGAIAHSPNDETFSARYIVTCNGHQVPLQSTGVPGEYVAGVRFRARSAAAMLHPAIDPHAPLTFELIDVSTEQSLGACTYHVTSPNGKAYEGLPREFVSAAMRMKERFVSRDPTPGKCEIPPLQLNSEYPMTLDLRRVKG